MPLAVNRSPFTGAEYTPAGPTQVPSIPVAVSTGWITSLLGSAASERFGIQGVAGLTTPELNVISDAIGHTNIRPANVLSGAALADALERQGSPMATSYKVATLAVQQQAQGATLDEIEGLLGQEAALRFATYGAKGLTVEERRIISDARGNLVSEGRAELPKENPIIVAFDDTVNWATDTAKEGARYSLMITLVGLLALWYLGKEWKR